MHSSVMNALIELLVSQRNKISCLKWWKSGGGGGKERLPEKVVTDVLAQVLGFSGVNFCLDIRLKEVTFVTRKVLVTFLMKNP